MHRKSSASAASALAAAPPTTTPNKGIRDRTPSVHALVGVRLVAAPGRVVDDAVVVVRDGVIVAAGAGVAVPGDARVWDLRGKTVYAGLFDAYSEAKSAAHKESGDKPGEHSHDGAEPTGHDAAGSYWNPFVVPQTRSDRSMSPHPSPR